jgi:hypothetical protein
MPTQSADWSNCRSRCDVKQQSTLAGIRLRGKVKSEGAVVHRPRGVFEKVRLRCRGDPTLTVLEVVNPEAGALQERRYWDVALPQGRNREPSREPRHGWEDRRGPPLNHGCAALVKGWPNLSGDWQAKASQRLLCQQLASILE